MLYNVLDARVGAIWLGSVQLQQTIKQGWGNQGNAVKPSTNHSQ